MSLGTGALKGKRGAESISRRGGIHGNPGSRKHTQKKLLTGTVALNESVKTTYMTHTYLETSSPEGGRGRGKTVLLKYIANDLQGSASSTARAMQGEAIALQVSRGPPRKSCTVKGETANYFGLNLTLPKLYLATFKLGELLMSLRSCGTKYL